MDAYTKDMINGYISAFDPYIEGNEGAKKIVEKFKAELYALGESCKDITEFMTRFQNEGYQDRYTGMFSTIYMQSESMKQVGHNPDSSQEDDDTAFAAAASGEAEYVPIAKRLTVKQFVEQYRPAYDEIKKAGNRKNAEAVYEELFAVADRTDDLQEMSLILEKESLLFRIASVDLAESGTIAYRSMDPHWDLLGKGMAIRAQAYMEARSDEELTYKTEITKRDAERADFNEQFKYGAIFGGLYSATLWWNMALNDVRSGGPMAGSGIKSLIRQRKKARLLWELIEEGMGLTWDDIVSDPYTRILLQYPRQLDELFRTKMVLPPESVDAVRYIWENELLSERSIEDILIEPAPMTYYMQLSAKKSIVEQKYRKKAESLNADLPYFEMYRNLTGGTAGIGGMTGGIAGAAGGIGSIAGGISGASGGIGGAAGGIGGIVGGIGGAVGGIASGAGGIKGAVGGVTGAVSGLASGVSGLANVLKGGVGDASGSGKGSAANGVADGIADGVTGGLKKVKKLFGRK